MVMKTKIFHLNLYPGAAPARNGSGLAGDCGWLGWVRLEVKRTNDVEMSTGSIKHPLMPCPPVYTAAMLL